MSDTSPPTGTGVQVSDDVRAAFPKEVDLILHSRSMNDEERSYWLRALPTMKKEQVATLNDILTTEKLQIEAIERKYNAQLSEEERAKAAKEFEERQKNAQKRRVAQEEKAEAHESDIEEDLLKKIDEQ